MDVDEACVAIKYYGIAASLPPPSAGGSAAAASNDDAASLALLEKRVTDLERKLWQCGDDPSRSVDASMRRARSAVEKACCYSSVWKWVPSDYYSRTLEQRRVILGAVSTYQLCKSMLMENKACDSKDCSDRTNSRFYLVVLQYEAAISTKKLESEVRALRPPGTTRLDPSKFDFRVAEPEDNDRLTGYASGAVTPFGLSDATVPIVMSKDITSVEPKFMWMGGGHGLLKLGMAVEEFVRGADAIVADVTEPRSG